MTMADLFQRIEDRKDEWNVEVMVTFLEIYNEEIRDLLAEPGCHVPRGGLSIREDKTVKVVGLVELKPKTAEEVKEIVLLGNLRRTQSPTHANETSSRSHAVLQVHVTQSPRTAALTEQRTMATLSIIDLAGSERAAATSNMGQRMVEGANINKSLLALGNCINALCESGGAVRHVPYRNSKLTRLLKFSLGGNCKTVMVVCIAPTSMHFDDTHNTLVYAERATKIKTKVVTRNVVNVDRHVGRYVEAINRLNVEIAELKQKLNDKKASENDVTRRKKAEASVEVERAKNDMKVKVEQTMSAIVDGALCTGKISVAKLKIAAIQTRLNQIAADNASNAREAERSLLQALAGPEEEAIRPGSSLAVRLQRSSNSNAMFDATLRAVSERRSEKLDDTSVDNVKLDAMCRRAEMEKLKAQTERDAVRDAVEDLAQIVVKLLGMLGRCTVMVGEAANTLRGPFDKEDGAEITSKKISRFLSSVKEKNDEAFKLLLGHTTEACTEVISSSLDNFQSYGVTFTRRISSGPTVSQPLPLSSYNHSRRVSSYGASNTLTVSPPRRQHKSPRKSLRSSLVAQPYRRVSDKEKKALKAGKNVQWRDEAGQGELDDGGEKFAAVIVIPASPTNEPCSSSSAPLRSSSLGGSESDWEDENEKTDDSVSLSFMSMSLPPSFSSRSTAPRRQRPTRLDPSFLKSKSRASALGSLAEDDESPQTCSHPLSEMSMNQMSPGVSRDNLHVPKNRDRGHHGSPSRRGPTTPSATKGSSGRRRSNIGPMRNDKGRRRSSMIPQLTPLDAENTKNGAKRLLPASPAKRVKRNSLTKVTGLGIMKLKTSPAPALNLSATGIDPNASVDLSKCSGPKPSWR